MTLDEYMSPSRFPLTTQCGLSPEEQMLIDSINYDEFVEHEANGLVPPEDLAIGLELKEKRAAMPSVAKQWAELQRAKATPTSTWEGSPPGSTGPSPTAQG